MNRRPMSLLAAGFAILAQVSAAPNTAALESIHAACWIGAGEMPGTLRLHSDSGDCGDEHHCGFDFSGKTLDRFTGIGLGDLAEEGAKRTATLQADAGTFTCSGVVHDGQLVGDAVFTPDEAFVQRMEQIGFSGFDTKKLEVFAFMDVNSAWVQSLQSTGIHGMTTDKLIALRIFHADKEYIQSITSLGYELPTADKLIELKVQGVDAAEVREIRGLGFQPNLDELVQIRIFRITPDFVRRMQARGLKNLTIAKLVQIRIFDLAD
jgi:hypothetical protein